MSDQRNMIIAFVLAAIVILGWGSIANRFFPVANKPATQIAGGKTEVVPNPAASPVPDAPAAIQERTAVIAGTPRIKIATPKLSGTINLHGARIDDLVLVTQLQTVAKNSPPIRLLSPEGTPGSYFAAFGWSGTGVELPGPTSLWAPSATELVPGKPVTLSWANGGGQIFVIRLAVDDGYMFSVTQTIENRGAAPVSVRPYGVIDRTGQSQIRRAGRPTLARWASSTALPTTASRSRISTRIRPVRGCSPLAAGWASATNIG